MHRICKYEHYSYTYSLFISFMQYLQTFEANLILTTEMLGIVHTSSRNSSFDLLWYAFTHMIYTSDQILWHDIDTTSYRMFENKLFFLRQTVLRKTGSEHTCFVEGRVHICFRVCLFIRPFWALILPGISEFQ